MNLEPSIHPQIYADYTDEKIDVAGRWQIKTGLSSQRIKPSRSAEAFNADEIFDQEAVLNCR